MNNGRRIFLVVLVLACVGLISYFAVQKSQPTFKSSLAPAFQLVGKTTKSFNTALGKIIPVDEMDEAAYGNAIKMRYLSRADTTHPDHIYLNELISNLSVYSKKNFEYQVFVNASSTPNAFAMPGGVIVVTQGFLDMIETEAELVSVLGHEMGHIERGHCFNAIKYELLMKKVKARTLGEVADFCVRLLMRSSYSKTQENEADDYGYELLLQTTYDPSGTYQAFDHLYKYFNDPSYDSSGDKANLFNDYYSSHPPTELRIEKFQQAAENWWQQHPDEKKYIGQQNLTNRQSYFTIAYVDEWVN